MEGQTLWRLELGLAHYGQLSQTQTVKYKMHLTIITHLKSKG